MVFDPFSGRGTTIFSARTLKRQGISSDLNPYAYIISKARADKVDKASCTKILQEWEETFRKEAEKWQQASRKKEFSELRIYYAEETLAMLIFIRETIGKQWKTLDENKNYLLALLAGIMHGPIKKDGSSIYLSIDMLNWVSMAPNYVKKYVKTKRLEPPKDGNLFKKLKARFEEYWKYNLNDKKGGEVFLHDAEKAFEKKLKDGSVNLVVTSPPYLNLVDYTNNNWLKLWLLGFERKSLRKTIPLSDNYSLKELAAYENFITKVLNNLYPKMASEGKVFLIVGDTNEINLIEEIWAKIRNSVRFQFEGLFNYQNLRNRKHSNTLNNKRGKTSKTEKILVLKRK